MQGFSKTVLCLLLIATLVPDFGSAANGACKTIVDPTGDAVILPSIFYPQPSIKAPYSTNGIDLKAVSLKVDGSDLIVRIAVVDLQALESSFTHQATYQVGWEVSGYPWLTETTEYSFVVRAVYDSGRWGFKAFRSGDDWSDSLYELGGAHPHEANGHVDLAANTITIAFPLALIPPGGRQVLDGIGADSDDQMVADQTDRTVQYDLNLAGDCPQ